MNNAPNLLTATVCDLSQLKAQKKSLWSHEFLPFKGSKSVGTRTGTCKLS